MAEEEEEIVEEEIFRYVDMELRKANKKAEK